MPVAIINSHDKYLQYMDNMSSWIITDSQGNAITVSNFQDILNQYVFARAGKVIEEQYFANYLEKMWGDVRKSIVDNVA